MKFHLTFLKHTSLVEWSFWILPQSLRDTIFRSHSHRRPLVSSFSLRWPDMICFGSFHASSVEFRCWCPLLVVSLVSMTGAWNLRLVLWLAPFPARHKHRLPCQTFLGTSFIPTRHKDFEFSDLDWGTWLHVYHTWFSLLIHAKAVAALLKYREWHSTCHDSPSLKATFWHTPQFDSLLALCLVRAELSMTTSGEHSW